MPLTMLIWPLPALLTWALAWAVFVGLRAAGLGAVAAFVLALLVSGAPAWTGRTPWRRAFMLGGFPLSLLATGAAGALPGWIWLVPLALLLLLYPLNTWRDAPLFPTLVSALKGLAGKMHLPPGASGRHWCRRRVAVLPALEPSDGHHQSGGFPVQAQAIQASASASTAKPQSSRRVRTRSASTAVTRRAFCSASSATVWVSCSCAWA